MYEFPFRSPLFAVAWLGVLTLIVSMATGVVRGSARATPPEDPNTLFEGVAPRGASVTDVEVVVLPADQELRDAPIGAKVPATSLGAADVVLEGRTFEVSVPPTEVPRDSIDEQGNVFLNVLISTDKGTYQANVGVRAVISGDGETRWADPLDPVLTTESGAIVTSKTGGVYLPRIAKAKPKVKRLSKFIKLSDSRIRGRRDLAARNAPTAPAGCSFNKVSTSVRQATVGTTYPVGNDTATMLVDSSAGAHYGTAVSVWTSSGWGQFVASDVKFTQGGSGFQWSEYDCSRSYQISVQYGLFELDCVRGCNKCSRQWYPINETGGYGETRGIARPDWGNCQSVPKGSWWRYRSDGKAYENAAGVKFGGVIGIDLSVKRNYTTSQKIIYNLLKGRQMCGPNGFPNVAGKVMSKKLG